MLKTKRIVCGKSLRAWTFLPLGPEDIFFLTSHKHGLFHIWYSVADPDLR